jgi:GWxTD domain-containing protein
MKKGLLFILFVVALSGCKVKEKKPIETAAKETTPAKVDKPIVNSVVGKYNFIDSTTAKVFIKANITLLGNRMSLSKLNESFRVQWSLQTDFGIREKISTGKVAFTPEFARELGDAYVLSFDVPRSKEYTGGILLVEFIHPASGTKYSYDLAIDFSARRTSSRYEIYKGVDEPIPDFTPYVYEGQPFVIKSILPSQNPLYLIRYRNLSKPALSPMSGTKRTPEAEFEIAETIDIKDREVLTLDQGMYVLTSNPEDVKDGYGFLVVPERYPRDTNPETLKEALVYMSTSKEIEGTGSYENGKDAMDMYFLQLAKGDQELARKIIRGYYKRVEEANEFFTTYKEGWKTDKGMVYIIMGPPARVQRNRTREVWMYSQNRNTSEIIYTFYKRPNVFTEQNYELVRYPEYSAFWYPYVESWRTGKAAE